MNNEEVAKELQSINGLLISVGEAIGKGYVELAAQTVLLTRQKVVALTQHFEMHEH